MTTAQTIESIASIAGGILSALRPVIEAAVARDEEPTEATLKRAIEAPEVLRALDEAGIKLARRRAHLLLGGEPPAEPGE